jgi:HAD superfamily hydrolase (TIGR01509 family)
MPAVLFGSISTVADTSELQRESFNRAFEHHRLDWHWGRDEYLDLLRQSGGEQRIADYAGQRGEQVDAAAVHRTKSQLFQDSLTATELTPRPGVVETIHTAKADGIAVGLVTTTSPGNVDALLAALAPAVTRADFDVVVDATDVEASKPDEAAYAFALKQLAQGAAGCVAIEDNLDGVRSAKAAGLPCVAFPNANTAGHSFTAADETVDRVDLGDLRSRYLEV